MVTFIKLWGLIIEVHKFYHFYVVVTVWLFE
jgi:hypothetical protein